MHSEKLEDLLRDGFSKKFALFYLSLAMKEYENPAFEPTYVKWAHAQGFLAESAYAYGLTNENMSNYLSDYDYYKVWPLNSWTRIWINDKLTLKYMLSNTEFSDIMPKYYYYSTPSELKKLIDAPNQEQAPTIEEFKSVLATVGEFACKPCNGTTSFGFFRMSYKNGYYYVNEKELKSEDFALFLRQYPNYIFTEYLTPSKQFEVFSPHIHTLRIVTLNNTGNNPVIVGGYLRIPNKLSGEANYIIIDKENHEKYNIFVDVDFGTGAFGAAKLTFANHTENVVQHPDTGAVLKGVIENYEHLRTVVLSIAQRFSTLEYMGFDIGITDNGFKCMEINSHPGIKYMQIFRPLLKEKSIRNYFQNKLQSINQLNFDEKQQRNFIQR